MYGNVEEWLEKAEGDFEGAVKLSKSRRRRVGHLTCFACQEAAEKYLKAFLVHRDIPFTKTHALVRELLPPCRKADPEFEILKEHSEVLDPYSVQFRYPGAEIAASDVKDAIRAVKLVRKFVRGKMDLEKQRKLL